MEGEYGLIVKTLRADEYAVVVRDEVYALLILCTFGVAFKRVHVTQIPSTGRTCVHRNFVRRSHTQVFLSSCHERLMFYTLSDNCPGDQRDGASTGGMFVIVLSRDVF